MKWTKQKPTEAGWYWFKLKIDSKPRIVEVREGVDGVMIVDDHKHSQFWNVGGLPQHCNNNGYYSYEPIAHPEN